VSGGGSEIPVCHLVGLLEEVFEGSVAFAGAAVGRGSYHEA